METAYTMNTDFPFLSDSISNIKMHTTNRVLLASTKDQVNEKDLPEIRPAWLVSFKLHHKKCASVALKNKPLEMFTFHDWT